MSAFGLIKSDWKVGDCYCFSFDGYCEEIIKKPLMAGERALFFSNHGSIPLGISAPKYMGRSDLPTAFGPYSGIVWYTEAEQRQRWRTPDDFWNKVNAEFHFDLDAAASPDNARCARYYTPEQDSLSDKCPWITEDTRRVWINPGFSDMRPWVEKAIEQTSVWANEDAVVCILGLIAPSSDWWKMVSCYADEVRLIGGKRIQFIPPPGIKKSSNARENCLLVFSGKPEPAHKIFTWDWTR